jgi:hypothetical protein
MYLLKKYIKWGVWRVAVCPSYIYRVFQKELYNFESLQKFIQRTYTNVEKHTEFYLG